MVVLRALLASRFRQQEHAIFASADLNNNDFISAQALGSTRRSLRDGIERAVSAGCEAYTAGVSRVVLPWMCSKPCEKATKKLRHTALRVCIGQLDSL